VRWLRSFTAKAGADAAVPWLTYGAVTWLDRKIGPATNLFEYGSGASTLYWLSRGATVCSVEHDESWFMQMKSRVESLRAATYHYVPAERPAIGTDPCDPLHYLSSDPNYSGMNFARYAANIDSFSDGLLDVVIVDGRVRPSCIMHGVRKLKYDGVLVLDNSDRDLYRPAIEKYLAGFTEIKFRGFAPRTHGASQTSCFHRPAPKNETRRSLPAAPAAS
jgi:hypothetical protein